MQGDRQEYAEGIHEERKEFVEDNYYYGRYGGYGAGYATGVAVGAAMSASAWRAQSCTPTAVLVSGVTYYQCGGTWYTRSYSGGSVTYVVTSNPY